MHCQDGDGRLHAFWASKILFRNLQVTSRTLHPFFLLSMAASYKTHACWLTLITGGCGVLRSIRVLHTILNRSRTRSNRLGPDPEPSDHLKYRPEPVRVLCPRVSGPPWRPLIHRVKWLGNVWGKWSWLVHVAYAANELATLHFNGWLASTWAFCSTLSEFLWNPPPSPAPPV